MGESGQPGGNQRAGSGPRAQFQRFADCRGLLRDGRFPPRQFDALRWLWSRRGRLAAVAREWSAQADAFEDIWGQTPTHLDSHQHVHLAPPLARLAVEIAASRGIPRIRAPRNGSPGRGLAGRAETAVFYALGRRLARRATSAGLVVPDTFDGFTVSGRASRLALREFRQSGVTEWMVHPGERDEPGGYARRQEVGALRAWAAE
ncbi:MAG TPA: ChbG/HpnK family deacetylase [Bacteroidetes bacterium]|nr:ChbG/HpnK family deacetylase [Bacteroidota bacterium]